MRSEARSEKSELGQARRKVVLRVFFMLRMPERCPPQQRSTGRASRRSRQPSAGAAGAQPAPMVPLPALGRGRHGPAELFFPLPLE